MTATATQPTTSKAEPFHPLHRHTYPSIVETTYNTPVVRNGRSCMGCHVKGMNSFRDEISATLQNRVQALFSLEQAEALYPGQAELDRLLEIDSRRFSDALSRAGGSIPNGVDNEPIGRLARSTTGCLCCSITKV